MPNQRDPPPEVTPASSALQPLTQRRRQLTQWFATVALGIMCFFGPYSYLQGRTQTSAVIAICGLLLLGMRVWIGRRPQSVLPPLLMTVACQVALMVGMARLVAYVVPAEISEVVTRQACRWTNDRV